MHPPVNHSDFYIQFSGKCSNNNCDKDAEFYVVFEFRAHPNHQPAVSYPVLKLCKDHCIVSWDDVCDEKGWENICNNFKQAGRVPPDKKYSNIAICPISGSKGSS